MSDSSLTYREITWAIRENIDPNLTSNDILTLYTLASCLNAKHQFQWSFNSLAIKCRLSRSSIIRSIKKLLTLEYLILLKKGSVKLKIPNLYQLSLSKIISTSSHKFHKPGVRETLGKGVTSVSVTPDLVSHRHQTSVSVTPIEAVTASVKNGAAAPWGGAPPVSSRKTSYNPESLTALYGPLLDKDKK